MLAPLLCAIALLDQPSPPPVSLTVYSAADPRNFDPQQFAAQQRAGMDPSFAWQVPGFGIVRETRSISLKQGVNDVPFTDVAAFIDPTTVSFTDTSGGLVRAQYTNNARGVEVQHWYGQQSSMGLAPPARHHQRLNAARKLTPGALHTGTTVGHSPAPLALRGLGVGGRLGSAFRRV